MLAIPDGWVPLYASEYDGPCEGLICEDYPFFFAQFHPEVEAGPLDRDSLLNHYLTCARQQRTYLQEKGAYEGPKW